MTEVFLARAARRKSNEYYENDYMSNIIKHIKMATETGSYIICYSFKNEEDALTAKRIFRRLGI